MPGLFIVVDGPDGAGKTTLVERLAARLRENGVDVVCVREPGGTEAAELARRGAFDPAFDASPLAELFFILAARADLVAKVVKPALGAGRLVLSDRYELSTEAYQVGGRNLPADAVHSANVLATGGLSPDLTLILDLPLTAALERQDHRGQVPDRMESEAREFHERVNAVFLRTEGPAVRHLDASGTADTVEELAWAAVKERLGETNLGTAG